MVRGDYSDYLDDTGVYTLTAWRCPTCGEVADPVILANRARRPEPHTLKMRRWRTPHRA